MTSQRPIDQPVKSGGYFFTIIIALVLAITMVIFALQNAMVVELSFLMWSIDMPLSLLVIATLSSGVLIAVFLSIPSRFRSKRMISRLNQQIRQLQKEEQPPTNTNP